jgi:hypothetical protein
MAGPSSSGHSSLHLALAQTAAYRAQYTLCHLQHRASPSTASAGHGHVAHRHQGSTVVTTVYDPPKACMCAEPCLPIAPPPSLHQHIMCAYLVGVWLHCQCSKACTGHIQTSSSSLHVDLAGSVAHKESLCKRDVLYNKHPVLVTCRTSTRRTASVSSAHLAQLLGKIQGVAQQPATPASLATVRGTFAALLCGNVMMLHKCCVLPLCAARDSPSSIPQAMPCILQCWKQCLAAMPPQQCQQYDERNNNVPPMCHLHAYGVNPWHRLLTRRSQPTSCCLSVWLAVCLCPSGFQPCPGTKDGSCLSCQPCPAGTYGLGGILPCVPCGPGQTSPPGSAVDAEGVSQCKNCSLVRTQRWAETIPTTQVLLCLADNSCDGSRGLTGG